MHESLRAKYGDWAFVAGAAEGLGEAWARALAEAGFSLVLLDRREADLARTASRLRSTTGVTIDTLVADLGDPQLDAAVARAVNDRAIGLLVYNAAVSPIGGFLDLPVERAVEAVSVNCTGLLRLVHRLGGAMATRRRGAVVLVSSLSAEQGSPRIATYAATKAFTLVFGEGLWAELRERGVDLLVLRPGSIRTPGWLATQTDEPDPGAPPPMEPDAVVAEALAALGGDDPSPVIGEANRRAAELMRAVPRRQMIEIMGAVTARLQAKPRA